MPEGFKWATMLERQGGDYRRVLSIRFGCRPDLRSVDEYLCDPSVLEPANAAGVGLAVALKTVKPMRSSVLESLSWRGNAHDEVSEPSWMPGFVMGAPFSKGASMGFLGIHGPPGRLRTYREPGPKPSLEDTTPTVLRASRNGLF